MLFDLRLALLVAHLLPLSPTGMSTHPPEPRSTRMSPLARYHHYGYTGLRAGPDETVLVNVLLERRQRDRLARRPKQRYKRELSGTTVASHRDEPD